MTNTPPALYVHENGSLQFNFDQKVETLWASQRQLAEVFDVDVRTVSEHIQNIIKTEELQPTIRKFRIVQTEGKRDVSREIDHYDLDMALAVGYRVNSQKATHFRQWATKVLRGHIVDGFTINKHPFKPLPPAIANYAAQLQMIVNSPYPETDAETVLELVKAFSNTWASLQAYDEQNLAVSEKNTEATLPETADDLYAALATFKKEQLATKQATQLFAQEKKAGSLGGIWGSVMQTAFGEDAYPSLEEKAAHLFYFIIKSHPFNDGNKRSAAFAFIWLLQKGGMAIQQRITPKVLTALTVLIAESDPKKKADMVALTLHLLQRETHE